MLSKLSLLALLAVAAQAIRHRRLNTGETIPNGEKIPVWVWWSFKEGAGTTYRLNARTWMKHIPEDKYQLNLVNESNIEEFYPNMPMEFYHMYPAAKTDFFRVSMLALHGGVYMDGDMLVNQDFDKIFKDVFEGDVEVMPYLFDHQRCPDDVSTNFMAGKKGNKLHRLWHEFVYQQIKSTCNETYGAGDDGSSDFKGSTICCYNPDGALRKGKCIVNFGAIGDKAATRIVRSGATKDVNIKCSGPEQGMVATRSGSNGELLWKHFISGPPEGYVATKSQWPFVKWGDIPREDRRMEKCWRANETGMECTASGAFPQFFERNGLHLFNLINNDVMEGFATEEELLKSETVIAEMYRATLGEHATTPDARYLALGLTSKKVKNPANRAQWGGEVPLQKMPWLSKSG